MFPSPSSSSKRSLLFFLNQRKKNENGKKRGTEPEGRSREGKGGPNRGRGEEGVRCRAAIVFTAPHRGSRYCRRSPRRRAQIASSPRHRRSSSPPPAALSLPSCRTCLAAAPPRLAMESSCCYHCHGEEALKRGRTRVSLPPSMGPRIASLSPARGGRRELEGQDEFFCLHGSGPLRKGRCCLGASRSPTSTEERSCGHVTALWRAMLGRRFDPPELLAAAGAVPGPVRNCSCFVLLLRAVYAAAKMCGAVL
ncbi:uncharacterized protein DS421_11g337670 [Arachis hypogaea]|nr:uncharacterized protein DS421_11g337670 [Arachis hypogaea]